MASRLVTPKVADGETTVLDAAALERQAARARRKNRVGPEKNYTHEGRRSTRTAPERRGSLMPLFIAAVAIWVILSVGMWLRAHPIAWPTFDGGYHSAEPAPRGHFPEPLSYPHECKQP